MDDESFESPSLTKRNSFVSQDILDNISLPQVLRNQGKTALKVSFVTFVQSYCILNQKKENIDSFHNKLLGN